MTRMDQQDIQTRVHAFAQRLLTEAKGDPVRALGLLVLVLEGVKTDDTALVRRLMTEVRRILVPAPMPFVVEPDLHLSTPDVIPIQHLAGDISWEGVQHCIRCGKVLSRSGENAQADAGGFPSGYVYQVGNTFFLGDPDDCETCHRSTPR